MRIVPREPDDGGEGAALPSLVLIFLELGDVEDLAGEQLSPPVLLEVPGREHARRDLVVPDHLLAQPIEPKEAPERERYEDEGRERGAAGHDHRGSISRARRLDGAPCGQ